MDQIGGEEFQSAVLEAEGPVLVDFSASWCGPCRVLEPVLKDLASGYEGKVKFVKVDIDEAQQVAEKYAVASVPTLILFKDGAVQAQKMGAMSKGDLTAFLESNL